MDTAKPFAVQVMTRDAVEKHASDVLKRHGLFKIPIDPVVIANREGIHVNNAVFSGGNISGMVAKRGDSISMLVNQSDPPFRKRFTIAHELGHHFLHLVADGEVYDTPRDLFRETEQEEEEEHATRRRMEVQANQFAAALLMPEELLRETFANYKDVVQLAHLFNVSETAMAIRLERLGLG